MSSNTRKQRAEVEKLLARMPENAFLQSLLNSLRLGIALSPKQLAVLSGISKRNAEYERKVEKDKVRVAKALLVFKGDVFLGSLLGQLESGRPLTEKQDDALKVVEARALRRARNSVERAPAEKRAMLSLLGSLRKVETRQAENDFVVKMIGLVEGGLKISPKQEGYLRGLFGRHIEALRGRSSAEVFISKVVKHFGGGGSKSKKASVERAWDYDRGEWAYRVAGEGRIYYASDRGQR